MDKISHRKRNIQIDLLKLFSMYCVFLGHTYLHSGYDWHDAFYLPINTVIYSVHMPLFMFVSGFFVEPVFSYRRYLNRVVDLMVPFVAMEILSSVFNYYYGITIQCWFFMSLLICYSFYIFITYLYEILKLPNMVYYIILLITCVFLSNVMKYKVGYLFPFYILGKFFYEYFDKVKVYKNYILLISLIGYTTLYLLAYKASYASDLFSSKWLTVHGLNVWVLSAYIVRFFTGLFGCVFIVAVFTYIKNSSWSEKLSKYGTYTLQLYFFCVFFCRVNPPLYQYLGILYQPACFVLSALEMLVCLAIVLLINKSSYMSLVLFNKGKRKIRF